MSFSDFVRQEARLVILRTLNEQPDGRLNSSLLRDDLDERWGINKTREWVDEELKYLEGLSAVGLTTFGPIFIATLLKKGRDHVERRVIITGVKRPSPAEE